MIKGLDIVQLIGAVVSDPLKIATEANGGNTTIFEPGEMRNGAANNNIAYLLDLGSLYRNLEVQALIIGTVVVFFLFLTMLFIRRSDKLADRKEDVLHKIKIIFMIASLLWILEILIAVVDFVF